jgi:multicomponent Na+:H+ antiporter subunit E
MRLFLFNILLAVLWMFMWGMFDIYGLAAGFILGYLLLGIVSRTMPGEGYGTKGVKILSFMAYFFRILIKANLIVAWEVITPGFHMTPRFIRYPIEGLSDFQLTSLANAITLTPGTLSTDVSEDGRYLYVHCMYAKDREEAVKELDELRHRMVKELFS